MKKYIFTIAFCAVALLFSHTAFAFEEGELPPPEMIDKAGFTTVITDVEGDTHTFCGVIDSSALDSYPFVSAIDSYEICIGGKVILKAELKNMKSVSFFAGDTSNAKEYCMVDFILSEEENTKVFITGLTKDNLVSVQEEIIAAAVFGRDVELEHIDFIDAEKQSAANTGDSNLCWAASVANVLDYTGWGRALGSEYDSCDKLFKLFDDSFSDAGGNALYAYDWFINGYYPVYGVAGWAQPLSYPSGNGFFPDYSHSELVTSYVLGYEDLHNCEFTDELRNGEGGSLGINWCTTAGARTGGHEVALWGFVYDEDFALGDGNYIDAFIISDSDDDKLGTVDRTQAPNKLAVCFAEPFVYDGLASWKFTQYGHSGSTYGLVNQFVFIDKYSEELPKEGETAATKNIIESSDLAISAIMTTSDIDSLDAEYDSFFSDEPIYSVFILENLGGADAIIDEAEGIVIKQTVRNKATGEEESYEYPYNEGSIVSGSGIIYNLPALRGLSAGQYSMTVEVNASKNLSSHEAYYYNNIETHDITILEKSLNYSAVEFTATVGGFEDGRALVTFDYEGLDKLALSDEYYIGVRYCYTDGDERSDYEYVLEPTETVVSGLTVPESCYIVANGDGVQFDLLIFDSNVAHAVVKGEICAMDYAKIELYETDSSSESYTPVGSGATAFIEGEQIAFKIINSSSKAFDGESVSVSLNLVSTANEDSIKLYQNIFVLNSSEQTEEIIIKDWEAPAYGTYSIEATISCSSGTSTYTLGELKAEEKKSCRVTLSEDKNDKYDGHISLREAIEYSGGEEVTPDSAKVGTIELKSKLTIDKTVAVNLGGCPVATTGEPLFEVVSGGDLTVKSGIISSINVGDGTLIAVNGGRLRIEDSRIIYNNAKHIIDVNGGRAELLSCSLKANDTTEETILVQNGGICESLNCVFFSNLCDTGKMIYAEGGAEISIMHSSLTDNIAGIGASDDGKMYVLGSVVTGNTGNDISGRAMVYGSAYGVCTSSVMLSDGCFTAKSEEIFLCDKDGLVVWEGAERNGKPYYVSKAIPMVSQSGLILDITGGKLTFTLCGEKESTTLDFPTEFTAKEFKTDMYGDVRVVILGGGISIKTDYEFLGTDDEGRLIVYAPKTDRVAFIQRKYTDNETLGTADINDSLELNAGTNYVNTIDIGSSKGKFMLWESLSNMKPICIPYEK